MSKDPICYPNLKQRSFIWFRCRCTKGAKGFPLASAVRATDGPKKVSLLQSFMRTERTARTSWKTFLRKAGAPILLAKRRSNSTRSHPSGLEKIISFKRQRLETMFSQITQLLPSTREHPCLQRYTQYLELRKTKVTGLGQQFGSKAIAGSI
jgi:hypothetical protein